ncbi:unnamed protein product [Diatraea saccharalis]|uniref:C2H2-type domain-containing protein n=1 Tax=Diatraea saccharalis TaxID=40085 RepID=A0A9N9R9F8_9NEOP|nr:unnamed protein product [Diatraea saccharalis]
MRTVDSHLLDGKIEETVTHYITTAHQSSEAVHVDANGLTLNVQEDVGGRVVTVMHPPNFTPNMCRQVTVGEQVGDGPWNEELLDTDGRIAALVAHLSQHSRTSQHQPHHMKVTSVRGDVDASVILDAPLRLFNGQIMEQPAESSLVESAGQLPPLPPLQGMKRCPPTDWFNNNTKTILKDDTQILTDSDGPVLELGAGASPAQNKQSKKSLPHKKRISKKLKRNTGNSTPQGQGIVVINCAEEVQQEEILPDNFVAAVQHEQHLPEENQHITHEVRPIFICQLCGEFYGEEQLKFYQHLKQHYEPHGTIIIENPVSDLNIDKMANTCIVDNVATLPDSIVELSLENTVPKTMYQPIDKHVLYTSSEKTLNYTNNKVQYSMASMDKEQPVPTAEAEKTDLYETLEKLELYSCMKCNKSFRKQKQCEAHIMEAHSNTKLEDISEFSEPEDLMEGIHVAVDETQENYQPLLPHLTVDSGHVHQEHVRHWYIRNGNVCAETEASPGADTGPSPGASPNAGTCGTDGAYCPVCPAPRPASPHFKEEVLQRIFDTEVSNGETNFSDTIIPDSVEAQEPTSPTEHKKVKRFECQHCSRVFYHRNSLMYHVLSHSAKQQMCRECGKSFYTAAALKVHKRVHNGDRPCKCDECGRRFRQWSDLKYHKTSIHSNQKHFRCEFCGKQFARKYSLNLHRKIHTGERDYKCEYCDKSFRASSYRLSHMRTHTGDRPYKCNECDKCFRVAGDLRRHSMIHEKLRHRLDESKPRVQKRNVPQPPVDPPTDPLETAASRRPTSKSTPTPKKPHKSKKNVLKKGAPPNVTVSRSEFKISDYENSEAFDTRQQMDYKFKDVYSDGDYPKDTFKVKEYNEQMYKENERLTDVSMIKGQICETDKSFVRGNTDGKMQIFTHIEKNKEYNGPIVTSAVSLGDIRHLERDVRDVRSDGIHGENIENGFLERLTALYNIPA